MKVQPPTIFPPMSFGKKDKPQQPAAPQGGTPPEGSAPPQDPNADAKNALAQQTQSDKEQEALTAASNMEKKGHDTCMQIIANIR